MTDDAASGGFRSILVATDGSDVAGDALDRAMALAEPLDAVVHVLSVVDPGPNRFAFGVGEAGDVDRAMEAIAEDLAESYDDPSVEVRTEVRRGRPYRVIVEYADEAGVDLVVLGRSGRDGVVRSLLGSTTDRVLREAAVPVLVVPGPEE